MTDPAGDQSSPLPQRPGLTWVHLDSTTTLGVEVAAPTWRARAATPTHWWLAFDGLVVAHLHTLTRSVGAPTTTAATEAAGAAGAAAFTLCDIEVRPGHRGRGHSRTLIEAAQQQVGHRLHTTAQFSVCGARALSWLPRLPGCESATISDEVQRFVDDWDALQARYPL